MSKPAKKGKADDKAKLREDFRKALHAEVLAMGPEGFKRADFAKRWTPRGVSRSSAFRWIDEDLAPAGQKLAVAVNATAIRAALPQQTNPVAAMAAPVPVLDLLRESIATAQQVMAFARNGDGSVRMAKTLLAASEHMRRTLETATKVHEAMRDVQQVEQQQQIILDEIKKESPETAMRIVRRLQEHMQSWNPA